MILNKESKVYFSEERLIFSTNCTGTIGYLHAKKEEEEGEGGGEGERRRTFICTLYYIEKLRKKWITDLNIKHKIPRRNIYDLGLSKDLNMTQNSIAQKKKV